MVGLGALELQSFYNLPEILTGKSVVPSFRFYATFIDNPFSRSKFSAGVMPIIRAYNILSMTLPTYKFKREVMLYGQVPRSFPVYDGEVLELSVTFEEDENASIAYFVNWMQRCIINSDGLYNPPLEQRIGNLVVEVEDKMGIPIMVHTFNKIFFIDSTDCTLDYSSNDSIKYTVRFGFDTMSTYFTKASIITGALGAVASLF